MKRVDYVLVGVSMSEGKGCLRCYVCGKWLGPPYNFHLPDCPAGALLKKMEEMEGQPAEVAA